MSKNKTPDSETTNAPPPVDVAFEKLAEDLKASGYQLVVPMRVSETRLDVLIQPPDFEKDRRDPKAKTVLQKLNVHFYDIAENAPRLVIRQVSGVAWPASA